MNQEQFEEMAAAYVLGVLSHDDRMTFERALAAATPEQVRLFEDMRLASRHLPVGAELATPSPEVKNKILSRIGAVAMESNEVTEVNFDVTDSLELTPSTPVAADTRAPRMPPGPPRSGTKPKFKLPKFNFKIDPALLDKIYRTLRLDQPLVAVGLPLVFLCTTLLMILGQVGLRSSLGEYEQKLAQQEQSFKNQTIELSDSKMKLAELETKLTAQEQKIADLEKKSLETTDIIAAKDKEINEIKSAGAQNQEFMDLMKATDLKVTDMKGLKPYPQGRAKVMFSPKTKVAYIHIANMPVPPKGKDYQLWMMEGGKPVSAGVLAMSQGLTILKVPTGITISPTRLSAFAITLEPKGGVPKPTGPMYMMGNVRL